MYLRRVRDDRLSFGQGRDEETSVETDRRAFGRDESSVWGEKIGGELETFGLEERREPCRIVADLSVPRRECARLCLTLRSSSPVKEN